MSVADIGVCKVTRANIKRGVTCIVRLRDPFGFNTHRLHFTRAGG